MDFLRGFLHWLRWRSALHEEVAYWDHWLATKGDEWPEDYAKKMNPGSPLDTDLRRLLGESRREFSILDVGSGPATGIGYLWEGRKLEIQATDPLAKTYDRLLEKHHVAPPVRTVFCPAEKLTRLFPRASFDLVHCRNALDHSYNPLRAIEEMVALAKPGGFVVLNHFANEAQHTKFAGLHQWNFDIQNGRFTLWSRRSRIDLEERFRGQAGIECELRPLGRNWVFAVLRVS